MFENKILAFALFMHEGNSFQGLLRGELIKCVKLCKFTISKQGLFVCVHSCISTNKTLRSVHFGIVDVEPINCKCGGIVRNQIW